MQRITRTIVTENTTIALKLPYNAQIMPYLKITAPSGKKITVKADNYDDMEELNATFSIITESASKLQVLAENMTETISYFKT